MEQNYWELERAHHKRFGRQTAEIQWPVHDVPKVKCHAYGLLLGCCILFVLPPHSAPRLSFHHSYCLYSLYLLRVALCITNRPACQTVGMMSDLTSCNLGQICYRHIKYLVMALL